MIIQILLFLYIFVLPGYLFSKLYFKQLKAYEKTAIILASTIFILPLFNFTLAWLLNTTISIALVLISTSIINIILGFFIFKTKTHFHFPHFSKKQILFFLLCLLIFFTHFFNFQGPAQDYWSTYIVAGSMFIADDKIDFTDINNNQLYDYELQGNLKENLKAPDVYGIITKDQRIGASITYSLPYLIFGLAGFQLFHSLIILLAFLFSYSTLSHIFKSKSLALLGSLIIALNPLLFYFNRLNANILSLTLISLILFLIIKNKSFFLVGIFYGILGGIRNIALILAPAILIYILLESKSNQLRVKRISHFIIAALIFILPILLWKSFAFGSILAHPTQYEGLYGYRPTFQHDILGQKFSFNGLLNYPFHTSIVRTPHFPFPNFITQPFLLIRSLGLLLSSFAIIGFYYLTKQKRNLGIFMLLLLFPLLFFLAFQENWEELKSSFLLMLLPPLSFFALAGINSFCKKQFIKPLIAFAVTSFILISLITAAGNMEFQKDNRWYIRFPHSLAQETSLTTLPEELRLDWQFFYTRETPEEYQLQRQKYTALNILPALYQPPSINISFTKFKNNLHKKQLTTLEVWNYIYG